MELKDWLFLIGGILLLAASIGAVIFSIKGGKHANKTLFSGLADVKEFRARVKALVHESEENYFVIFETEESEEVTVKVSDDMFKEFTEGEAGLLTLADGELLSFVIDEEV